ncbi:hypothetical protein NTH37_003611 [Vibrio fluvialis]|nr:hypothetical protein [Vibrio fluvialis]
MDYQKIEGLINYIKENIFPSDLAFHETLTEVQMELVDSLILHIDTLGNSINDPFIINHEEEQISFHISEIKKIAKRLVQEFKSDRNKSRMKAISIRCNRIIHNDNEPNAALKEYTDYFEQQTGQHERYLERIKTEAINEIRTESSVLREQLQDEARQIFDRQNNDLRSSISSYNTRVRKESAILVSELQSDFSAKLDDLEKKYASVVGERIDVYESRFSDLQNKNIELNTSIANIKSSISSAVQESKDSVLEEVYNLQDDALLLKTEISNASKQLTKDLELETEKVKKVLLQSMNDEIAQYKKVKELLNLQVKNATDIVGTLSKKAMAHEHILQANREFKTFLVHQILGVIFLLGAVAMSIAIFSNSLGINVPWLSWLVSVSSPTQPIVDPANGQVITTNASSLIPEEAGSLWFFKRMSILILLTAPGIYFLKEAAVHRSKENVYRQRGVQLAAIAPYLNELEPCERQGIKKDLVKTFFSFHDGKADTKNVPDFLRDLKETMKIVRSIDKFDPHNRVRKSKRNTEES